MARSSTTPPHSSTPPPRSRSRPLRRSQRSGPRRTPRAKPAVRCSKTARPCSTPRIEEETKHKDEPEAEAASEVRGTDSMADPHTENSASLIPQGASLFDLGEQQPHAQPEPAPVESVTRHDHQQPRPAPSLRAARSSTSTPPSPSRRGSRASGASQFWVTVRRAWFGRVGPWRGCIRRSLSRRRAWGRRCGPRGRSRCWRSGRGRWRRCLGAGCFR